MNNERYKQIIDEAYEKYADSHWTQPSNPKGKLLSDQLFSVVPMEHSKEEFINKCKTDLDFSQKWGLKIEERELTDKERLNTLIQNEQRLIYEKVQSFKNLKRKTIKDYLDEKNIPTRLITLTYNNEKIEIYE